MSLPTGGLAKMAFPVSQPIEKSSPPAPRYPDIGILALPPEPWSEHWTARHHILTRLCRYFHVVWVNPALGWRSVLPSMLPLGSRAADQDWPEAPKATGFTNLDSGLAVFNPGRWLPGLWRTTLLSEGLLGARLAIANRRLRQMGCSRTVLQLWRPVQAPALRAFKADLTCYHIDDEYSFSPVEKPVDRRERDLIAAVDQVFICSENMFRKKGELNRHSALLPNGVDYQAFSALCGEPEDLRGIPHPRVGYVGVIKKQIDLPMLAEVSAAMPTRHFVLVGPIGNVEGSEAAIAALRRRPNVHFLGAKPARALPGYVQHMDVCLMSYCVDGYTKFISPLKVNEYLAAGKPVVGSPIEPLMPYADVIRIARTPSEWVQGIEAAMAPAGAAEAEAARRRQRAQAMDWDGIVGQMAEILRERLKDTKPVPA
jgi:glycosyltransferase involved in cell wall biosynthesis